MECRAIDTALVVEGGALRGVFSTGLLDGFLAAQFNPFDLFIGVSSGASNLAAYLAGMAGRNRRVYLEYSLRPDFIDIPRFLRGGHLIDLDWLWAITIREIRLDLAQIYARPQPFVVVMTDALTGTAVYRTTEARTLEHLLKASSSVPLLYRGYPLVDGRPMSDGGVADAIPVGEAIRRGARRIMVVRSRHRDYRKKGGPADFLIRWHVRHYPLLRAAIAARVGRYNDTVALIRRPPAGVSIVEVCPPPEFRVSRLSQDIAVLTEGYDQGRSAAAEAMARWEKG
ncbi:MAG: patatin-like phospholipase family protein [Syntrophales bacterium]